MVALGQLLNPREVAHLRERQTWVKVFIFLLATWLMVGCGTQRPGTLTEMRVTEPEVVTSPLAKALPSVTAQPLAATRTVLPTPVPTLTAVPASSPTPTSSPTATATPTATPSPTPAATQTPLPTLVPVNRRCPDPAPTKPEYNHFWLANGPWPTPDPAAESHFWLAKPLPGGGRVITSQILPYGYDGLGRYLLHNGSDMAQPMGTPVLAVGAGTVIVAQSDEAALFGWRCDWYGHLVIIQLDQTWRGQPLYALYGHVLNISVAPGDRVTSGQQVAEVGIGGAAVVPHLHFELRVGENSFAGTRNPLLWLSPGETRGVIAGRLLDPEGRPWQGHPVQIQQTDEITDTLTAWTYLDDPQHLIHPDEGFAENFVLADLRPGNYEVWATVQGEMYRAAVVVNAGSVSTVELVTAPYKTPTPAP